MRSATIEDVYLCGSEGAHKKLGQPLWESVMKVPQKLKRELPYDPTMPLLNTDLADSESADHREPHTLL